MRRVIIADIRRIVFRIWPWIFLAVAFAVIAGSFAYSINDAVDREFFYLTEVSGQTLATLVIGFVLILGIFGDEFKSMAMIGIIGRGLNRDKFVLAKFFDEVILGIMFLTITAVFAVVIALGFNIKLSSTEVSFMMLSFLMEFLELIAYLTISAMFFFLSENVAMGVFAFLSFEFIIPVALYFASMLAVVQRYHLDSYYVSGLLGRAFSDFIMGDILECIIVILITIIAYIGLPLFVTMFYFRKKEMEF